MSGRKKSSSKKPLSWLYSHIKQLPEDFQVEEVLPLKIEKKGDFCYYLLTKKNFTTLEIVDILSRRLHIPRYNFGLSGLKDRRAITSQYLSIREGPPEDIKGKGWSLKFIGYGQRGIEIGQAIGNIFTVTLRRVDPDRSSEVIKIISQIGFANYFGIQRFSPDMHTAVPVAKLLLRGKLEEALKE